ncbi:hypothetical protein OC861_001944 [Tilletia horrida]|nr:hypothetical protein OC861_001944 [Tilletia horrida]
MRQAQLSFAPVSAVAPAKQRESAEEEESRSHADSNPSSQESALFPPTNFPRSAPGTKQSSSLQQGSEMTPLKDGRLSSPDKGTPGLDFTMSSSPVSSASPASSPINSRVHASAAAASKLSAMGSTSAATKPTSTEDNGFEIVIPVSTGNTTKVVPSSTPASSTAAPKVNELKPKPKKALTEEEKAAKEQEATAKREAKEKEKAEREAKREAKEQEQKAKKEAKEEQARLKAQAQEEKEEQQRQKKEAKEAKEEEQRAKREAKDAERQKKEDVARKQAATQAKTRNFMTSFLKKPGASSSSARQQATMAAVVAARANAGKSDFDRAFVSGVYKGLAPTNKWHKPPSEELLSLIQKMDSSLSEDESTSSLPSRDDLLADLKSKLPRRAPKRQRDLSNFSSLSANPAPRRAIHHPVVVRQVMRAVAESDIIGGEAAAEAKRALDRIISDRSLVRLKFIDFQQDRRPGWYGSFTRPSNLIGPRRPFAQDPVILDYSYDSDDEWEDQGQLEGEDLDDGQEVEEDDKEDDDDDSEMDDWLIDDLEEVDEVESVDGGLEGPGSATATTSTAGRAEDDDRSSDIVEVDANGNEMPPSQRTTTLPAKRKAAEDSADTVVMLRGGKQKRVKALGRRFNAKLIPFATGPHWEEIPCVIGYPLFKPFQAELLNNATYGLDPFTFECVTPAESSTASDAAVSIPPSGSSLPKASPVANSKRPSNKPASAPGGANPGTLAELFAMANAQDDPLAAPGMPPHPALAQSGDGGKGEKRSRGKGIFPDELLPEFLRLVDGSSRVKPVLVEELKERFADVAADPSIDAGVANANVSKAAIEKKLNEVATKEGKGKGSKWVVKGEFRARYGLPALTAAPR